jgi:hypothetical protein
MNVNLRNYVEVETVKNEKSYRFLIPFASQYDEAREVLKDLDAALIEMEQKQNEHIAKAQAEQQEVSGDANAS